MSSIFGGGTSGASEQSQQAQIQANRDALAFIEQQSEQARGDIVPLFGQAQDVLAQGTQGALDVISGGLPAQFDAFQQGNVLAQQQLQSTLPQFQNAILGLPTQFPQQAQTITPDFGFSQGLVAPQVQPAALQPSAISQNPTRTTGELEAILRQALADRRPF